jgi:hypothetical protein
MVAMAKHNFSPSEVQEAKSILEAQAQLDKRRNGFPDGIPLALLKEKIESGKQLSCFIMSALTNVPERAFDDFIDLLHAIALQLAVVYKVHAHSPLLDSESSLHNESDSRKPRVCYEKDLEFVEKSDFLIFESTYGSTGGGQEMQHAADHIVPAVLIAQMLNGAKEGISFHSSSYVAERTNGENGTTLTKHSVFKGRGGVSLMLQGNPSVQEIVTYSPDTWATKCLQSTDQGVWGAQYWAKDHIRPIYALTKGAGKNFHAWAESCNPRSILLSTLADTLENVLGLVPRTVELEKQIKEKETQLSKGEPEEGLAQDLKELRKKMDLVKQIRNNFHPAQRNRIFNGLTKHFPELMDPRGPVHRIISSRHLPKSQLLQSR